MKAATVPVLQRHWDLRAAINFAAGGARGGAAALALAVGLALVGAGLFAVWLEIGRPWRALNVLRNPRTSWMSREAWAGIVLFAIAGVAAGLNAASAPGARTAGALAAAAALAFAWCQGRILRAARGIPAWRSPATPSLIVATALAEGFGAWTLVSTTAGDAAIVGAVLGALVLARWITWLAHRRTVAGNARVVAALAPAGRALLWAGTVAPLALAAIAAIAPGATGAPWLVASGGALALCAGTALKVALVLRGAYQQGYAIPHLPVRGARG